MRAMKLAAVSERFAALHERWAGAIPLDDLGPYLAWYRALSAPERRTFRLCVLYAVLGVGAGRSAEEGLRTLRQLAI